MEAGGDMKLGHYRSGLARGLMFGLPISLAIWAVIAFVVLRVC